MRSVLFEAYDREIKVLKLKNQMLEEIFTYYENTIDFNEIHFHNLEGVPKRLGKWIFTMRLIFS